ncbi:MAG: glycosyltransferase family 2 protein [Planctomycetota bacterium]
MAELSKATLLDAQRPITPDVSVLIVGYNCRDLLIDCLEHLLASIGELTYEVVFIENGHCDDSVAVVQERYPGVRIVDNDANHGFGGGNNRAAAAARGKYVLLLNPDTRIEPDALAELWHAAEARPGVGGVGGITLHEDGSIEASCAQPGPTYRVALLNAIGLGRYCRSVIEIPDAPVRARVLSGAFMMLPRELWNELGGFDESYFLYNEETDLCLRVAEHGRELWLIPSARLVHLVGSGDSLRPDRLMAMTRSGMHLTRRRMARWRWPISAGVIFLHSGTRWFGSWLAWPVVGVDRARRLRAAFGPVLFGPQRWWRGWEGGP